MRETWKVYLPAFNARALAQLEICERAVARRLNRQPPKKDVWDGLLHDSRENLQEALEADIEEEVRQ